MITRPYALLQCAAGGLLAVCLLTGCFVTTVYPFYRVDDPIFDKSLLGTWTIEGQDELIVVSQAGEKKYTVLYYGTTGASAYDGHLLELGRVRYIDLFPRPDQRRDAHHYPVHSLWKVSVESNNLHLTQMDEGAVRTLAEDTSVAIAAKRDGDSLLLTSPTEELQAFVRNYSDQLFKKEQEGIWRRK